MWYHTGRQLQSSRSDASTSIAVAATGSSVHAHCGPYSLFFIPENSPADMVRVMSRCGVSRAILSSLLAIQLDARLGNESTANGVAACPDRISTEAPRLGAAAPAQDCVTERQDHDRQHAAARRSYGAQEAHLKAVPGFPNGTGRSGRGDPVCGSALSGNVSRRCDTPSDRCFAARYSSYD